LDQSQQRWDGGGQEWWNARTNEWQPSYDRTAADSERWDAGGFAPDWKQQTPSHKRADWDDWSGESPFDTAPARIMHGDRFADPQESSKDWGGWDERWTHGSANGFDARRRRDERVRRNETRPDRTPRPTIDPLAVASVLPAPVLPKPAPPAPPPEPPAPRTNIKFTYTITKGPSVPAAAPDPQVSDTTASEKASEKDANEITPSETAPDKTSRVGSESENES